MLPLLIFFMMGKIRQCYPLCFLFAPTVFYCKKTSGTLMFFCLNDKKPTVLSLMFSSTTRKYDSVTPYVFFHNDKLQQRYPFWFFLGWKNTTVLPLTFFFWPDSILLQKTTVLPLKFSFITTKYDSVTSLCIFFYYWKKNDSYPFSFFLAWQYFI